MKESITSLLEKRNSNIILSIITFTLKITLIILFVNCSNTNPRINNSHNNKKDTLSIKNNGITELRFINKRADFGEVPSDTLLIQSFNFINTGNNKLVINYVNPDCLCTGFKLSEDTVLQGDTACIKLKFDTHNKFGKQKIYI